ncbi:MAG: leucine--tRNA ligase [Rickettsiales bacterium]|jgi:leucyl-tRNA synthetase|nr:leucine--tRNA ligase [Rickettsiales bacterium]
MNIRDREKKWQKKWAEEKAFTPTGARAKKYALVEFPYPSGTGLHGGHMMSYSGMDVMARFWRKKGFDVLFPIGFDSLGISAEKYATSIGKHPSESVRDLISSFTKNMNEIGWSFDPESVVATSDPEFIKWTQWQFIQFFKAGLAYKSKLPMNWCPNCKTTLTNEELEDGNCERCHGPVEKKMKEQWNLRITKYADRLIDDLELVDYPDKVKSQQINWIGRSFGAEVDFKVLASQGDADLGPAVKPRDDNDVMQVYTTRIDTIYGVSFAVLAPEHALIAKWLGDGRIKNADAVRAYIAAAKAKSEIDRTDATKEKTGVLLEGVVAKNPFTNEDIPLFAADYVLADYGFGAVMGVPAHDQRDWDFAKKFGLKIIPVLAGGDTDDAPWEQDGLHINSGPLDGLDKDAAIKKALEIGAGFSRAAKQYKLKDWGFSRQMYWGEPIPLVWCPICGWQPVPESELPVLQPFMDDYKPTPDGESPLARATDWVNAKCPCCGGDAKRETDTMPQWAGSSWYYMRYLDPQNDAAFCAADKLKKWMPVDHYNGGMEHTTRHLIYSRFWYKALFDLGLVPGPEPYAKRTANGVLLGKDGKKMSKSAGNGFLVSDMVGTAGADASRLAVLSLGPWSENVVWSDGALAGAQRFMKRIEALADNIGGDETPEHARLRNQLAKDVAERIENMQFNTAIAAMMEYINAFSGAAMPRACYETLLHCVNPFAPHLAEELWEKIGGKDMLVFAPFPVADESKLGRTTMTIVVAVNGKRRAEISVNSSETKDRIVALASDAVVKYITGEVKKTIFVPGKMVNFVL